MKKNKIINYLFIFISIIFLSLNNIKAVTVSQVGSVVEDKNYFTSLKMSEQNAIFCTSFKDKAPISQSCQVNSDWNEKTRYAVAAIIKSAKPDISLTGMTDAYFAAELAINHFLYITGQGGANINASISDRYKTKFDSYLALAQTAYNTNYSVDSSVRINVSESNLKFTLKGDNYESNEIIVSGVDTYSINPSIGRYSKTTKGFKIVIPTSEITNQTTVNVVISSSKTLSQARNYNCGTYVDTEDYDKDGNLFETLSYQTITPTSLETVTKSSSITISGTISTLGKLTINKLDGDNKHLSGASIKVVGNKGYKKIFESTGQPIIIENLEYDTYTIEEIKVPSGYIGDTKKTITLSNSNNEATVELINKKIKIIFSKLDSTGKKELPGAFLEIQDEKGKVVKLCPGTEEEKYVECSWVSAQIPYEIEGLPIGKYYLVETKAPKGYVLNKEKVMFEITGKETNVKVEMKNALNKVVISKISAANKKELPGATLEIQDSNGRIVEFCTDSKELKNKPCTWISSEKPYEIYGMPNGTYYLVETIAPNGYILNKEKIKFVVDENKSIVEVEMKNELEVKVPDTLSSKSVLLMVISMFDIALGIGIINYVKKNKIQE